MEHHTNSISKVEVVLNHACCFHLTLLNFTQNSLAKTHLEIQAAPRIEVAICFFYGEPCTQHFYRVKCSKSVLIGRIYREQSLSFLVVVFHYL